MHICFATTGLHGICNESKNGMEDRGGGFTHSSPTALGLGISDPAHTPKFPSLIWDWEGAQSVLSSPTRLQEI